MSSMSLELTKEVKKQEATKLEEPGHGSDDNKGEKDSYASNSNILNPVDVENQANKYNKGALEDRCSDSNVSSSFDEVSSSNDENLKEDLELDRLLRLVSGNPCGAKRNCTEEKETEIISKFKPQCKEVLQTTPEPQPSKLTLMDCFNPKDNDECGEVTSTDIKRDDFISQFNSEAKNSFLFTSESCTSDGSENEREEKALKKINIQENEVTEGSILRKRLKDNIKRKNDLQKYRISTSEDEEEEQVKCSKAKRRKKNIMPEEVIKKVAEISEKVFKEVAETSEKVQEKSCDEDCDIVSDSETSVKMVVQPSDSDPEIVKVDEVPQTSGFKKGRKNISKILDVKNLQVETKQALKMETERKRRLKERQELIKKFCEDASNSSKLVLDFDPVTMKELVVVDENLSKHLKLHQREGVQFMWDCCFENLNRIEKEKGSGCVLAHCMGLGKTFQVITLVHSVLTHSDHMRTVLIISPLVALKNWFNEFKLWMTGCSKPIEPFDLGTSRNKNLSEMRVWMQKGGVLIISYDMFRTLVKKDRYLKYRSCLLDPGPDIVVCDEGHLMKNPNSELSKCVSRIRTLRRIVLTGTPLQNNLIEYYCMVQFVKPNILGTKKEFFNRFVNPITNGQFENSTQNDVFLMKQRSHVLHKLLQSFVQRLGYDVLEPLLPEKQEFVISVALTETQEKMYNLCIKKPLKEGRGLLWDFHWFHKVWTHPLVMKNYFQQNNVEKYLREPWESFIAEQEYNNIRSSNKLLLLFSILQKCRQVGDKVIVFSHSLYTLGLIENFLLRLNFDYEEGKNTEFADSWKFGLDYFKLTGSTKPEDREMYFEKFRVHQRARLFLITTKAGGLGINLVAANRVILFDASWNPVHDLQSIFRIYRFGQKKPCYIYRFLAAATMEEEIYKRQVTKLSLAHRILDERQIERHYSTHNLLELYSYNPLPKSEWKIPRIPKDKIFAEILSNNRDVIVGYHEHNSLLENKEEEELTEEEQQAAWENYEKEKASSQKVFADSSFSSAGQQASHELINQLRINLVQKLNESYSQRPRHQNHHRRNGRNRKLNGYKGSENFPQVILDLEPYNRENVNGCRNGVECELKTVFPWGIPEEVIQVDPPNN